jgi:hypothetical protein
MLSLMSALRVKSGRLANPSFLNHILKGHAVVGVPDLLAGVDVDNDGHCDSLSETFGLSFKGSSILLAHRSLFCSSSFAIRLAACV